MKKVTSLLLAAVSTAFLLVGATQAAERFDGLRTRETECSPIDLKADGPAQCNYVDVDGQATS